jgi:hypothetical protein
MICSALGEAIAIRAAISSVGKRPSKLFAVGLHFIGHLPTIPTFSGNLAHTSNSCARGEECLASFVC